VADAPRFEINKDRAGKFRWQLIGANGSDIIADSGQGYSSEAAARQGIAAVRKHAPNAPIAEK